MSLIRILGHYWVMFLGLSVCAYADIALDPLVPAESCVGETFKNCYGIFKDNCKGRQEDDKTPREEVDQGDIPACFAYASEYLLLDHANNYSPAYYPLAASLLDLVGQGCRGKYSKQGGFAGDVLFEHRKGILIEDYGVPLAKGYAWAKKLRKEDPLEECVQNGLRNEFKSLVGENACKALGTLHEVDPKVRFHHVQKNFEGRRSIQIQPFNTNTLRFGDVYKQLLFDPSRNTQMAIEVIRREIGSRASDSHDESRSPRPAIIDVCVASKSKRSEDCQLAHSIVGAAGRTQCCPQAGNASPVCTDQLYIVNSGSRKLRGWMQASNIADNLVKYEGAVTSISPCSGKFEACVDYIQRPFDIKSIIRHKDVKSLKELLSRLPPHRVYKLFFLLSTVNFKEGIEEIRKRIDLAPHLATVEAIMANHKNFSSPDRNGLTPLQRAIKSNMLDVVEFLIEMGANPNLSDTSDISPLATAIHENRPEIFELLVAKGARINKSDLKGNTLLHLAVAANRTEIVGFLLKKGADPGVPNKQGHTATDLVLSLDNTDLDSVFFKGIIGDDNNFMKLVDSIFKNKDNLLLSRLLKYLPEEPTRLAYYLIVKAVDRTDQTAAEKILELRPKYIHAHLADPKHPTKPLLDIAVDTRNFAAMSSLAKKGVNFENSIPDGFTALTRAALRGDLEVTEHLLKLGAKKETRDSNGHTTEYYVKSFKAKKVGPVDIEKYDQILQLLESGLTPNESAKP